METLIFQIVRFFFGKRLYGHPAITFGNARVFKGKVVSINKIIHDIQIKSYEWIVRRSNKRSGMDWQLCGMWCAEVLFSVGFGGVSGSVLEVVVYGMQFLLSASVIGLHLSMVVGQIQPFATSGPFKDFQ
ncbi:hypothetical protein Tco_0702876 [Tanacetum coccineum]|uniref:Uncharacterized protein n=1 Tax=Tanacetum coccineum TaxID=301880 RepID=A0ABQ4XX95_9ASTR